MDAAIVALTGNTISGILCDNTVGVPSCAAAGVVDMEFLAVGTTLGGGVGQLQAVTASGGILGCRQVPLSCYDNLVLSTQLYRLQKKVFFGTKKKIHRALFYAF